MADLNTNSGLGAGPGLIVPSPSGAMIRYSSVGWSPTGSGNWQTTVVAPRVGGISTAGTGNIALSGYNATGSQGTVDVVFTTGTAGGSNQFVAGIVDSWPTPTGYLGIFLDNENRPFVVVTDVHGTIVASTEPLGPAFPAGTTLHCQLEWNSHGAFNGADFVVFEIGDTSEVNWGTEAGAAWTPFVPAWLSVGQAFASYVAFTGTIGNVQLGNGTPVYVPPVTSFSQQASVGVLGNASFSVASSKVVHSGAVSITGSAVVPAITATKAGP